MALASMKREADSGFADYNPNQYGYGLQISLNDDQCEALGITKALRAGQQVTLRGMAVVVSSTESIESDGDSTGPDICLSLQITDLEVKAQGTANAAKAAAMLYGSEE